MGDFWGRDLNVMLNTACNLSSGISYTVGQGGSLSFTALGTATVPATTYSWISSTGLFGTGASVAHSFSPGVHTVTLITSNNYQGGACNYTSTSTFSVEGCKLSGGIVLGYGGNGQVNFSTSISGTVSGTTYMWNFGAAATATGATASYTFPPGTHVVTLTVNNNFSGFACKDTYTTTIIVDGEITGLREQINEISIFPNPTAGDLQVQCVACEDGQLLLFDATGKNVLDFSFTSGFRPITLSDLPDGIYFYRIEQDGIEQSSGKLVLRR